MNDFRRGVVGGLIWGIGGTLALVLAALAALTWEDLR